MSKQSKSSKAVEALRDAKPSLKEVISGKGTALEKAVAEHEARRSAEGKAAEATLKELKKLKKGAAKKGKTPRPSAPKSKKTSEPKVTVASFIRALIIEGKENVDIFEAAVKRFGIGEDKRHYPSWYRSELKRKPELKETAAK